MKNYKTILIALTLSVNANANVFTDVGDWVSDNKGTTAIIGVGALATASVVIKPLKWLQDLVDAEGEEVASSEMLAGATGLQGNSLEAIASKLNVEEDTVIEGAVGGLPDPEYSNLSNLSWTPTLDNITGSLRADGYSDAEISNILKRDAEVVSKPMMRDRGSLIEGIENPNKRIIDPSGLLKDVDTAAPKGGISKAGRGFFKGGDGFFKGARNKLKGVKGDRL